MKVIMPDKSAKSDSIVTQLGAKQQVVDFLRKATFDDTYNFALAGDEEDAERFVHRMRVELSRLRKLVREGGRTPKPFKMKLVRIVRNSEANYCTITLQKADQQAVIYADELGDALQELTVGEG